MPTLRPRLQELSLFLGAWLREPGATAAIAPSSEHLARLMTQGIRADAGPVVELGPGTGVFTRAVLARGLPEAQLWLIEREPAFAALLRRCHPAAHLWTMDARQMRRQSAPWDGLQAQAVLSGLPLLTMGARAQLAIVGSAFRALHAHGQMLQFTYGARCPVLLPVLQRLGLRAERLGGTWANLPPASVYALRRDGASLRDQGQEQEGAEEHEVDGPLHQRGAARGQRDRADQ